MSVTGTQSSACCTLPPVESEYTPKGTYTDIAGLKTYVSGPEDADEAIVLVYDVFGFSPQILQGADLLASQGFRVFMPDFCKGDYADGKMFSGTPEDNERKTKWFSGFPGAVSTQSQPISEIASAVKAKYSKVGGVGYCWGYKAIVVSEGVGKFDAIAGCHPSFPDPSDVEKINVPLCLLPSQNEDMDIMNKIHAGVEAKAPGKNFLKQYDTQPHGWCAARGDLKSEEGKTAFRDAYTDLSSFFKKHL